MDEPLEMVWCETCGKEIHAPEAWTLMTTGGVTLHFCSHDCKRAEEKAPNPMFTSQLSFFFDEYKI